MKILLLGSGGREHAIALKLSKDTACKQLFIAPGNAGTSQCGTNIPVQVNDFQAIRDFILKNKIKILIVGPEEPLVKGIADFIKNDPQLRGVIVIGPSKEGAQLEGSKAFSKRFMQRHNIPTAAYSEVTTVTEGVSFLKKLQPPYVLKADGLAAGKGVLILNDFDEAVAELTMMLEGKFGDASRKVVIEAFLSGIEFSVFVITDGKNYKILPEAKDYKRIGEGDTGLNTGGMGAISPVPFVKKAMWKKVEERIIKPTINGLASENIDYQGFIFFGLISVRGEPYVIEYNCRMGDPETEVVMPRLKTSLVHIFKKLGKGDLDKVRIQTVKETAATVMLVAGGYPGDYKKGDIIKNTEKVTESTVYHAGTTEKESQIVTNGGRVIAITSFGNDIPEAIEKSNKAAEIIDFEGKYYRRDIGLDLIKK
jgi:phosphoribosylamine---glycine ligase